MQSREEHEPKKGGCFKLIGSGIGLLLLLVFIMVAAYGLLRAAGSYLVYSDELEPASAIVVLSGGTESRMREALRLYKEGYGKVIILTETGQQTEGYEYLNSFDMRIQLLNNGVPNGNIIITDLSVNTTVDEAVAVRELLKNRQYGSAIVVTDPYHTRRAAKIFHELFSDTGIKISIQPVRSSWYKPKTWFLSASGWKFTLSEYLKLISMKFGIAE